MPEETPKAETAKEETTKAQETAAEEKKVEKIEEEPFDKDRAMATITKLRDFEKEGKKAIKRLAEFEAEEAKRKEAEMTELQKATKRAEEAEAKAKKLERDALKSRIAADAGLPPELASRLEGETEDEMKSDAEKLAAALPKGEKKPNKGINPGTTEKPETDEQKRERLLGNNPDPWAVFGSKEKGGGIFVSDKE